ncbi:MAG: glycosyltransferase family 4 protein [Pelotomaculum sp.]|uniref:Glycosyltransferase n=1 Tax=Pelotomaculum thermopropionicum (strain DSM 13744 / JCM 10971 / SI) TaxID=370438 RepID=A5D386_PELTS|nr:glycosyltransferase family 4 protein [Pelotomaculum sp.]BAF59287.1 glycosyltransferase [Pelotomaculum thermopropionicum SI]
MRVLMISGANIRAFGGDAVHTFETAGGLARAGVRVTLLLRGKYRGSGLSGIKVVGLPVTGIKYLDWLIGPLLMCLAALVLTVCNDYDAVYVRDSIQEMPAVLLLRLLNKVVVLEVNAAAAEDLRSRGRPAWKLAVAAWAQRRACLSASLVLTVTAALAGWLAGQGVPAGKVVVVANGANPYLYRPMDREAALFRSGLDSSKTYLCFAGNLAAWQGAGAIIDAFARLAGCYPDAVLLIIGDGQERLALEGRVRRLGLQGRVIFTGWLPYPRVPLYMNASVAGIGGGWCGGDPLLRRRFACSGSSAIKVFSYLACGLPVVIPDIPDLADVVRRAGCGLVAAPDRLEDLAAALKAVLDNPRYRAEAGLRGRAFIEREGTWEHRAAQIKLLIEQKTGRAGGISR